MAQTPREDIVAQQYKKWQYPDPIQNLETYLANSWEWYDPSHAHRVLWPDRPYQPESDILIAGCGTNQASVIAYNNRAAKVTAIDISQESLDHVRYLKDKYNLKNLDLHLLPIEEVGSLDRDFDLVMSTGVLHHMASSETGMKALADVLRPDGVAAIMLYARYGRIGVEMMQGVFRDMGLRQDEESLEIVKQTLDELAPTHPARTYMSIAPDLYYDAGLVDTFLHGRDRSFTVQDCLDLVEGAGLVFQDWFMRAPYYPPLLTVPNSSSYAAINDLPTREMWAVMERLRNLNGCHFFMACRPDRPTGSYRIDFSGSNASNYVPLWRHKAGIAGDTVFRNDCSVQLGPAHLAIAQAVDGERTIRDVAARAAASGLMGADVRADAQDIALDLFEQLWRLDFLSVDLSRTG